MKKEVFAKSKYVLMSARKVRLVVDMIRNKKAIEAVEMLQFVDKAASLPVRKTLESAITNAIFNFGNDKKALKITTAFVDEAPTFKRGRATSRGRYRRILKRNCHIVIGVMEEGSIEVEKKTKSEVKKSETKKEEKVEVVEEKKPAKAVKPKAKSKSVKKSK